MEHFRNAPDRRNQDAIVQPTEKHFRYFNSRPPSNIIGAWMTESNMFSALLALLGFNLRSTMLLWISLVLAVQYLGASEGRKEFGWAERFQVYMTMGFAAFGLFYFIKLQHG